MAVLSLNGVVESESIKTAGASFDEAIVKYVRRKHNLLIGSRTAEDLKKSIRETVPLSVTQAEQIRELREWAATRAVLATAREDREAAPSGAPAGPDGSLQSGVQGGRIVDFD